MNHFLIETWNEILTSLEDPNAAASLMSIDFEKAFNRMSHHQCLNALKKFNAKEHSIDLVHAFLFGRTMQVKIGTELSAPEVSSGASLEISSSASLRES